MERGATEGGVVCTFQKRADYPLSIKSSLSLLKNNTFPFTAFFKLLIIMKAMLAVPIPHGVALKPGLFLHHALIFAQPPFRKVHLSTSFQKRAQKTLSFESETACFSVPVRAAAFCTSLPVAE